MIGFDLIPLTIIAPFVGLPDLMGPPQPTVILFPDDLPMRAQPAVVFFNNLMTTNRVPTRHGRRFAVF